MTTMDYVRDGCAMMRYVRPNAVTSNTLPTEAAADGDGTDEVDSVTISDDDGTI